MTERFQRLLDAHGTDLARWSTPDRADADRLLATDPPARALWERARRFDERLAHHLATASELEAPADQRAASRVLGALAELPAQRGRTLWSEWSSALLDWDFTPAWPRIAALAGVAVLGFAIGLVEPDGRAADVARSVSVAEADVGAVVFEPEPLTGARP